MTSAVEANADGLIGPTHSYAGLSPGNLASSLNKGEASNPRAAVLQGLDKMKTLADLGLPQFVLPPHERPNIPFLRDLGFSGRMRLPSPPPPVRPRPCGPPTPPR